MKQISLWVSRSVHSLMLSIQVFHCPPLHLLRQGTLHDCPRKGVVTCDRAVLCHVSLPDAKLP